MTVLTKEKENENHVDQNKNFIHYTYIYQSDLAL